MKYKEAISNLKKVFGSWKYIAFTLLIAGIFYVFNAIVSNFYNLIYFFRNNPLINSMQFLFLLIKEFHRTILPSSVFTIIIIGLLTGVLVSLLFYRYKVLRGTEKIGILAGIGLFFGVFVPGCASCGIGLVSLLGFGSVLAYLPFQGKEISWLAIILLSFSIIQVSNKLLVCKNMKVKGGIINDG